ncbi:hypothetical protein EWM64_g8840 [Hericium alpestre]|uniref:Uncharacterized protein n=1 Tax=Hericium alpestre TaxID=135208 RepID=A0A4Y9ZM65_9AGAM|nr:hypothetical protein EWM64_g8840 [Hericium alpestre]
MKLKLTQLTSDKVKLLGYINIPVFLPSVKGPTLELEVEAYIVSDMSAPILLGEDFHLNYKLDIK